jgi:hypothetical protein
MSRSDLACGDGLARRVGRWFVLSREIVLAIDVTSPRSSLFRLGLPRHALFRLCSVRGNVWRPLGREALMAGQPIRLKYLLRDRHWHTHRTFCVEYDKVAEVIDPALKGTWPSRTQLHRWLSGDLKGLPYPDHCRILEGMFPGWSVAQLFEPYTGERPGGPAPSADVERLFDMIGVGLATPDSVRGEWGSPIDIEKGLSASRLPNCVNGCAVENKDEITQKIGRKLVALSKMLRLAVDEMHRLAGLAGNVVDLEFGIEFDITADGWARVTYHHEFFNMSDKPIARIPREVWFEHTKGPLKITPISKGAHRVAIQRVHDTPNLSKFACRLSPAIQPGETTTIGYTCEGGQFVSDHYWRQATARYTRHFTISLRHRGGGQLVNCTATEERPDGSEYSAAESLMWDTEGSDVIIMLTRDYLRPHQAMTLRWEVSR